MQDEIIPHLEPGRLPSTIDPDAVDKDKKLSHRPVRISAWKLAKLDSNEAIKAGAKARASSSVLRPVGAKHHPYDADHLSSGMSGRSSPASTNHGFYDSNNARAGTSRSSPSKSSYPPSRASREDIETCGHSMSNLSSPLATNLTPSPLALQHHVSNRDHFNPIYQSSADQSPWSAKACHENETPTPDNLPGVATRKNNMGTSENTKSSVFWDQEAGRFVTANTRGAGSTSQVSGTELTYTGQSIFFGGPLLNENVNRGGRSGGTLSSAGPQRSYYQGRTQRGGQLPVFVPSDPQQNQFSSRLPRD